MPRACALQPGCVRLRPGCVRLRPGCMGLRPGCMGLHASGCRMGGADAAAAAAWVHRVAGSRGLCRAPVHPPCPCAACPMPRSTAA
eukprot:scaffold79176_cov60-Phaeocystis_antarctica.AAC.1